MNTKYVASAIRNHSAVSLRGVGTVALALTLAIATPAFAQAASSPASVELAADTVPTADTGTASATPEATEAPVPTPLESPLEVLTPTVDPTSTDVESREASRDGRVSGTDRFATAVQLSKASFQSTAPVVVVATGESFPDALSAGPAAVKLGGPLLLTYRSTVPKAVVNEIARLKPKKIQIVGGINAVSAAVEKQLQALAPVVDRFAGADRFETSRIVTSCAWNEAYDSTKKHTYGLAYGSGYSCQPYNLTTTIGYFATGSNFPDALAAGAAAGKTKSPVLLVPREPGVLAGEYSAMMTYNIRDIRLVGGTNALASSWEGWLKSRSDKTVRLAGSDRFGTAVAINAHAFPSASGAFIATGSNFPDALAGAAAAGKRGMPLYLSLGHCVPPTVLADLGRLKIAAPSKMTLIGGPNALNANVEKLGRC